MPAEVSGRAGIIAVAAVTGTAAAADALESAAAVAITSGKGRTRLVSVFPDVSQETFR